MAESVQKNDVLIDGASIKGEINKISDTFTKEQAQDISSSTREKVKRTKQLLTTDQLLVNYATVLGQWQQDVLTRWISNDLEGHSNQSEKSLALRSEYTTLSKVLNIINYAVKYGTIIEEQENLDGRKS